MTAAMAWPAPAPVALPNASYSAMDLSFELAYNKIELLDDEVSI